MITLAVLRSNVTVFLLEVVDCAAVVEGRSWEDAACPVFRAGALVFGGVLAMIDSRNGAGDAVSENL